MGISRETRTVTGFTEVSLGGYGELTVEQNPGGGEESVVVEADASLMDRIACEVRGTRLVLAIRMPWYEWLTWWLSWLFLPDKSIRYRLQANTLEGISVAGSGRVRCASLRTKDCRLRISGSGRMFLDNLVAESLDADISGSGRVECSGTAQRFEIDIRGSGRVRAEALQSRQAAVHVSGSGRIDLNAAETLSVRISGSGSVRYRGDPRVTTEISGSGRIRRL
jgi:hypothetical protein